MAKSHLENAIDQIQFLYGLRYNPKYATMLEALQAGEHLKPLGVSDAVRIHGAIRAILVALKTTVEKYEKLELTPDIKLGFYELILQDMDEKSFGGKWFNDSIIPQEGWVDMSQYDFIFKKETETFYLPAPYVNLLQPILN